MNESATVLGIDNVPLELPVARIGSRTLAAFLDYVIVAIAVAVWGAGCAVVGSAWRTWWALAAFLLGYFVIEYGYFATVETLRGGQTFGKWALGLRVVTRSGARPGTPAFLIRNAVRGVDVIVGVFLMAADPLSRRLGDRLAGTLVVHAHPATEPVVVRSAPAGWTVAELAVIESLLQRGDDLEGDRGDELAAKLLACIATDDPVLGARVDRSISPLSALRALMTAERTT